MVAVLSVAAMVVGARDPTVLEVGTIQALDRAKASQRKERMAKERAKKENQGRKILGGTKTTKKKETRKPRRGMLPSACRGG